MMNYTDKEVPYTRTIEHKHFEGVDTDSTWVTWEYPEPYDRSKEPYYPVNDSENTEKYNKYKKEVEKLTDIYFGGRLAEYKYYDMHQVIESALNFVKEL
jgi:UDP-galactopyranose mutase